MKKAEKTIKKIKKDCLDLQKRKDLTEYGKAELALINIISKESD